MQDLNLYHKRVLTNGLTVLAVPLENAASITMSVFIKVGSRYEEAKLNGISHFLEHLHFKGSKKYPTAKKLSEVIDEVGGDFNANTGKEHTQYYIRTAYEHLPLVVEVLTDMIQNPLFEEREIQREKGVIIEEINMYKDNPQMQVESIFEETLWPDTSLGRDIAGNAEIIRAITKKDIINYRNTFYQPSNIIIAISGKFDLDKLNQYIDNFWGHLPNKKTPNYQALTNKNNSQKVNLQTKETEQAHMIVGFKAYPYGHKNNDALKILTSILGGGMSSRLFTRIRERLGLAYYVSASYNNYRDAGNFLIQSGLKVSSAPKALEVIMEELRKIRNNSISASEIKKAKEYIKGKIALALEDPHDKLEWYLGQEAFLGKITTIKQRFERIDKVTIEEVSAVAHDIIKPEALNVAIIGPFKDRDQFEKKINL